VPACGRYCSGEPVRLDCRTDYSPLYDLAETDRNRSIDGSGKNTQMRLLEQDLTSRGFAVYSTGFPQYESWFGRMVGNSERGLGPLDKVIRIFRIALCGDGSRRNPNRDVAEPRAIVLADRYVRRTLRIRRLECRRRNAQIFDVD